MGIFDGILIVSDIDGTFLGKGSRVVPENLDAIKYFTAEGGRFTFATGRIAAEVASLTPGLEALVNAPMILANGAYMYDLSCKRVVATNYIDGEKATEAAEFLRANYPDVGFRISRPAGFLTDAIIGVLKTDLVGERLAMTTVLPLSEWRSDCADWYKMVVRGESELLDEIRSSLERHFDGCFDHYKSAARVYELVGKGCSKAAMLSELRKALERESGNRLTVYACGDFENDIPMLAAADIAACPAGAIDEVKNICSCCLCDCDDGFIADLIGHIETEKRK